VTIEAAVFETASGEKWLGDPRPIENMLKYRAEDRRAWRDVLHGLEQSKAKGQGRNLLTANLEALARNSNNPKAAEARAYLAEAAIAGPKGETEPLDRFEVMLRTARCLSEDKPPHGRDPKGRPARERDR
jgi:hypothetical protein